MPVRSRPGDALAKVLEGLDPQVGAERARYARSAPRVLRAAGMKIEKMSAERLRAVAGNRQAWQAQAWGYRDLIPELRFALQFRARTMARVRFYAAQINPEPDDEPLPLALRNDTEDGKLTEKAKTITVPADLCEAAENELGRLPLDDGFGFTGTLSENFDVAGEAWMHGYTDPVTDQETWKIRSVLDVDVQGTTLTVKDEVGQPRPLNLRTDQDDGTEEIHRLWVPHPAHPHLADSASNALQDVYEDICLLGREMRAVARSRIASNGVWLITEEMAQLRNVKKDDDEPETSALERFMADFTAAMLAPIVNEGDPGGVAPMVITASREDISIVKDAFLRFAREDSPTLLDKLSKALGRMATSLDIPPEILTGMAEVNHWGMWQIDNSTFRHYLEPSIRLMADSLTVSFLRPALIAAGFPPEQVNKIRIWYDAGQITENPNRRQDALDARDRAAISDDAFRQALGFNDADAPSAAEQIFMIAARNGMDAAAATAMLRWFAQENGADLPPELAAIAPRQIPAPRQEPEQAEPDDTAPGGAGVPDTAPDSIAAAATRRPGEEYALDRDTGRRLMDLERALRAELLAMADAATSRALERAGSRLRSKATKDPALTAALRGHPIETWPMRAGRTQAFGLGADVGFLLAEAWDTLREAFRRKVRNTYDRIADLVAGTLLANYSDTDVRRAADRIRADMDSRLDTAWQHLRAGLDANAERLMFEADDDPEAGELPDLSVPPALIRTALAEIGGLAEGSGGLQDGRTVTGEPVGGLATGSAVTRELEAAGTLTVGYVWVYGVTPMRRQFEPHRDLEGEKFTSWADPKLHPEPRHAWVGPFYRPGDHRGCFVGDTVVSGPRPVAGFERPYVGEGIEIRTDAGHQLTGTPNHPVLTPRGWVALGELQEGDQLVVATGEQGPLAVNHEYQQVEAAIEKVATALPMAGSVSTAPVPSAPEDFHGDGTDGDVTVVRTDGGLLADLEATGTKLGTDDVLQFAGCVPVELSPEGVLESLLHGDGSASGGRVGVGQTGAPLLQGGASVGVELSGTHAAPFDPHGIQPVQDGLSVYPVPSSESLWGFAGEVALAEIVQVNRVALSGHVYNLSTLTGWYVANGIIAHNCMCDYVPAYALPDYAAQVRDRIPITDKPTQDLLKLAAADDSAGRTGTTAQAVRDQYETIRALQSRFLEAS